MRTTRPISPPDTALRLLSSRLPIAECDDILGDLCEMFADRVESGRHFNRLWFWAQTLGFLLGFAMPSTAHLAAYLPSRNPVMLISSRMMTSLRQSLRRLAFEWRYAAGVVLILGVGIGPAAAMLSIVERVWLQPLDYRDPGRLGIVRINLGQIQNHPGLALSEITDLRHTDGLFAGVEAEARSGELSFGPPERLEPVTNIGITPGLLPMLGIAPVIGRQLAESDANMNGPAPVLLDYGFWQSHFGGDADIINRTILINGRATQVAGVLPQGFILTTGRSVPRPIDVYTALRVREHRNFWGYPTLVRLKDGQTFDGVNAALATLAASLVKQYPKEYSDARLDFSVRPLQDDMLRDTRPALRAAMGGVLLLLLIAVANSTALVVARLKTRERDLAIRSAIGAGRGALVTEVLMESMVLSGCGALAGCLVAAAAIAGARALVPHTVPRWDHITLGWELVAYSLAFAVTGLFAAGLIPVWKISRSAPWQALRVGSIQGGRAEGAASRLMLVGAQIALTVVLAFGAAQLVRSAAHLSSVNLGFDPNVLTVRVPMDFALYRSPKDGAQMYERVRDRLRQVPGVTAVGAVSHLPLSGSTLTDAYTADMTKSTGWDQSTANYYAIEPGYFSAMRIPLLTGRDFTDDDDINAHPVVVVDETLTRAAFPGVKDVIGRKLKLGWGLPDSEIIGVVGHVRGIEIAREVRPQVYAAFGGFTMAPLNFTIRAVGGTDPSWLTEAVQRAVYEVGPGRALSGFAMLTDNVDAATSTLRSVTGLVTILAMSAGLLSAVGLYTVIAYLVHQRKRATAIRSALGASRAQLVWHHMRTSGAVIALAVPIGTALAIGAAPLFATLVYGVAERDVTSLVTAALVAAGVGLLGTFVPIRRAAGTDPVMVLRGE